VLGIKIPQNKVHKQFPCSYSAAFVSDEKTRSVTVAIVKTRLVRDMSVQFIMFITTYQSA